MARDDVVGKELDQPSRCCRAGRGVSPQFFRPCQQSGMGALVRGQVHGVALLEQGLFVGKVPHDVCEQALECRDKCARCALLVE